MSAPFAEVVVSDPLEYFEIRLVQPRIGAEIHRLDLPKPLAPPVHADI